MKHILMSHVILLSSLAVLQLGCSRSDEPTQPAEPTDEIQYVAPEQVGWSSVKLDSARLLAQQSGYAAVMAAYDGRVFFSWWGYRGIFLSIPFGSPFCRRSMGST